MCKYVSDLVKGGHSLFPLTAAPRKSPPHKSLKENGISCAKTDGYKIHMTPLFVWRLKKPVGFFGVYSWFSIRSGFILVNLACCLQFSWQWSLGCAARAAVGSQKDLISFLIVVKNHLLNSYSVSCLAETVARSVPRLLLKFWLLVESKGCSVQNLGSGPFACKWLMNSEPRLTT